MPDSWFLVRSSGWPDYAGFVRKMLAGCQRCVEMHSMQVPEWFLPDLSIHHPVTNLSGRADGRRLAIAISR
jgi:hypothetical protein